MRFLISLLCCTSILAERPSRHALLAKLEPDSASPGNQTLPEGKEGDTDIPCRQEEALKAVLKGLGVNKDELQNVRSIKGASWKGCKVVRISFPSYPLDGLLDGRFLELPDLQALNLANTKVKGDLAVLKDNTKLEWLVLHESGVSGDLNSLRNARQLEHLDLSGTTVSGDLVAVADATKLQHLDVSGTSVSGDLVAVAKARKLQHLDVSGTSVSGDLVAVADATKLQHLDVSGTRVSGDLAAVAKASKLQRLDVSGSRVSGDLMAVADATKLQHLDVSGTSVSGDLVAVAKARKLQHLDVSGTSVSGDLVAVADATKLQHLDVSLTSVSGDLVAVAKARKLHHFHVSRTEVFGDVENLKNAGELRYLRLSGSKISGALAHWKEIQDLQLSGTKVQIFGASFLEHFWPRDAEGDWICPFPLLKSFDVSGTTLSTTVEKLLRPFLGCWALEAFKAAECNLTGGIPRRLQVDSQGSFRDHIEWPVSNVLEVLDLASNNVTRVEALPPQCQVNDVRTVVNHWEGYSCFDVVNTSIRISPEKFAPNNLCGCSPGWKGSGAQCEKCPRNTYVNSFFSRECEPCPADSMGPEGATSITDCVCAVGELYNTTGTWECGCGKSLAKFFGACVDCSDLHLDCSRPGSDARSAKLLPGYIRLENATYLCLKPLSRCNASDNDCSEGYTGPMCMDCTPGFFAQGEYCEQCHDTTMFSSALIITGIIVVLAAVGVGTWLWMCRSTQAEVQNGPSPFSAFSALKEQLKAQVPILLQLCQLWAVLALLLGRFHDEEGTWPAFWEVPYVEALQLSVRSFKSAFNLLNLQCRFDAHMVRFVSALLAPAFALAVMLCCLVLEFAKPGFGITAALQALTLLYIGGASSTSSLSSCQYFDGNRAELPLDFAFRPSMPFMPCHEDSHLQRVVGQFAVFYTICYGIVIPCCLLYLYGKQHVALQVGRTTTVSGQQQGDLTLCLSEVLGSTQKASQKDQDTRRLVAATAGYISVLYHGRVQVRVAGGTVFVKRLGECRDSEINLEAELLSYIHGEDVKLRERQLKCRSLSEMLMERVILEEVVPNDRIMFGMKHLLVKYSLCRNVWMEIVQKLVAMLLVSVVETEKALQFSLGITLTMAAVSAMIKPYAQPQANRLHFYSFICLALAAASFHYNLAWPARAALAVPFMVTAAQALKPDNSESLALRLWEELEPQMETLQRGEPVEVLAETYNFR